MNFYYLDEIENPNDWWGMFIRDCKQFFNLKRLSKHNGDFGYVLVDNFYWQSQKDFITKLIEKYSTNNNLIFVLTDTSEGYPTRYLYYDFFEILEKYNIPKSRRMFMYNNAVTDDGVIKECEKFFSIYYPAFLYEFSRADTQPKVKSDTENSYNFSCFNRRSKVHKLECVKELLKRNLNSATTFDLWGDSGFTHDSFLSKIWDENHQYLIDSDYFLGKINICTESEFYSTYHTKSSADSEHQWDDMIHLTEKVYRNIAWGIPYVLISSKGSLNEIRRLGLKTFDSIIDESYDLADDSIRISLALDAAQELLKKHNSVELNEILEYNKKKIRTYSNDAEFFNNIVHNPLKNYLNNLDN
jgi:hypothetical protein